MFVSPVHVAPPKPGEFWDAYAMRERAGRIEANHRLVQFGRWYDESVRIPLEQGASAD